MMTSFQIMKDLLTYLATVLTISAEFTRADVFKGGDKGSQHDFLNNLSKAGWLTKRQRLSTDGAVSVFRVNDAELLFTHLFNDMKNSGSYKREALQLRELRDKNLSERAPVPTPELAAAPKHDSAPTPLDTRADLVVVESQPVVKEPAQVTQPTPPSSAQLDVISGQVEKMSSSVAELMEQNFINAEGYIAAFKRVLEELRALRNDVAAIKGDVEFLTSQLK